MIRLAADDQAVTMCEFDASLALGSALELLSPTTELVIKNTLFIACHNLIYKWFIVFG